MAAKGWIVALMLICCALLPLLATSAPRSDSNELIGLDDGKDSRALLELSIKAKKNDDDDDDDFSKKKDAKKKKEDKKKKDKKKDKKKRKEKPVEPEPEPEDVTWGSEDVMPVQISKMNN